MPWFKTLRADVQIGNEVYDWQLLAVKELASGDNTIIYNGVSVPVTISPYMITIHVGSASGDLEKAKPGHFGDDWTMSKRRNLQDVSYGSYDDDSMEESPLHIYGDPSLLIEWFEIEPELFRLTIFDE